MTPEDQEELHRLSDMLEKIDGMLPEESPLREALEKAGLSLTFSFIDGRRSEIEQIYQNVDAELSPQQRDHLKSLGIDPDQA